MQSFLSILPLVIIISLIFFGWWYNSPKQKGKWGEQRVNDILSRLPKEYHVLGDIVLKTKRGTTQIDHIVVSKYGVIAIETKNYRGDIYGDDNRKEWTQLIVTKVTFAKKWWKTYTYVTKKHFYNPVKQSAGHALKIKELLTAYPHVKIVPIVVFTGEAVLKNIKSNHHVIYEDCLLEVISGYKATYLTDNDVQTILTILNENNIRESVSDREHVKNIQTAVREVNETIKCGVCPKCNGHLVERRGKYGTFYGCSNYPQCRFTVRRKRE